MAVRKPSHGFTLLELATVLVIIAVVAGMGMYATLGALDSAKRAQTERKLDVIEKALMQYRIVNEALPCPANPRAKVGDSDYAQSGYVDGSTNGCDGPENSGNYVTAGSLPVGLLNLPYEYMYDGWGRKFLYAVTASAADLRFMKHQIAPADTCAITVQDGAHATRSAGAVYVLVSFGPNGHGAKLPNGTDVNAGSTNADELTNCNCNSSGVANGSDMGGYLFYGSYPTTFVQKDATVDTSNLLTNSFDDIVRFKNRWQMQTDEDAYNYPNGVNGMLAIGYAGSGTHDTVSMYYRNCGIYTPMNVLNPKTIDNVTGVAFIGDNSKIFVYSNNGCYLYPITYSSGVPSTGVGVATPAACPAYNGHNVVALSKSGMLAISQTASPYVKLFTLSGGSFAAASDLVTAVTSEPSSIAFSNDARLLVVSNSSYTYVYYRKSDGTYDKLATQPTGIPANPMSATLSPGGQFLAVGADASGYTYVWSISATNAFTAIAPATFTAHITSQSLPYFNFSQDGKWLNISTGNGNCSYNIFGTNGTSFSYAQSIAQSSFGGPTGVCKVEKFASYTSNGELELLTFSDHAANAMQIYYIGFYYYGLNQDLTYPSGGTSPLSSAFSY